ncbi:hypothetical protein PCCS19_11280 [Paenibacillus sp. CCS19]|uniref:hypothetical protein n=1 Tax=Paenibacillus sp. CCS19 TaxID=3158387 RepID=UPI00256C989A|nr:hypothetical protein [Paenibacillus cellulosilyticus]GMK38074.1 hypothetical protein PCCS19_11280 [Paenibacillus cellulosilyticus]
MRYITLSIIAIILLIVFAMFFGPFGSLVLLVIAAGVIGHLYAITKQLESRITELERRQGIIKDDDYNLSNEDIENELEQYIDPDDNK